MQDLVPSDVSIAVIPTLAALAIHHFKHGKDEDGEATLEPKHPAVKFILRAWNEGEFGDAHQISRSTRTVSRSRPSRVVPR